MSKPRRVVPPLNLLAVFEAAGRHASFTRAAEELGVSQPAVSHSVRQLEQALGVTLFVRAHRGVTLSASGRRFMQEVAAGLGHIHRAARALRGLTVCCRHGLSAMGQRRDAGAA